MSTETFYDVVCGDRIVIPRLPKERAEALAAQMGEGYSARSGSDEIPNATGFKK